VERIIIIAAALNPSNDSIAQIDDKNLISALAGNDDAAAARIEVLLLCDSQFAEIHEEYHVAKNALLQWQIREAANSRNVLQYKTIMMELEQELRIILSLPHDEEGD
jgi:hypothetical protein